MEIKKWVIKEVEIPDEQIKKLFIIVEVATKYWAKISPADACISKHFFDGGTLTVVDKKDYFPECRINKESLRHALELMTNYYPTVYEEWANKDYLPMHTASDVLLQLLCYGEVRCVEGPDGAWFRRVGC